MAQQSENTVTIYQNGIAAFERMYDVGDKEPKRLSLPFKKDVIGDVAATLSIVGDVEVIEAPNYSPTKEKPALEINPSQATHDLFTKLSGAAVTITKSGHGEGGGQVKGRVAGYQTENVLQNGSQTTQHFLTLQKEDGTFERMNFGSGVNGWTFTDQEIQTLIKKALDWNVEKINPESVYLSLALKGNKPTKACLKYTIPSPPFKLTYRVKQIGKSDWMLYGYAVVDNHTDEDWNHFNVNCATGQPVTFATDITELRIPVRSKVNLVNDTALGAFEAESSGGGLEAESSGGGLEGARGAVRSSKRQSPAPEMAAAACGLRSMSADAPEAAQAMATAVEIGDTSFFRSSEPVTIPAKKSGLVKIIEQKLPNTQFCLYYQPDKNNKVVMRALKVTNDAIYTLGRGCVSIEQEGAHMGSAILSMTKPTETAMLCHAQETGTKPMCEVGQEKTKCMRHSLAEGMMVTEWCKSRTTVYTFRNVKDESFTLKIDHQCAYDGGEVSCNGGSFEAKLANNANRYSVNVPAKGDDPVSVTTVTVHESTVTHSTVKAGEFLDWINRNPDSPLLKSPALERVVLAYKELCACTQEITTANGKLGALKAEQDRLHKNCDTLKGVDNSEAKGNLYKAASRLMAVDDEIVTLEQKTIPALEGKKRSLTNAIREAAMSCTAGWTVPEEKGKVQAVPDAIKELNRGGFGSESDAVAGEVGRWPMGPR